MEEAQSDFQKEAATLFSTAYAGRPPPGFEDASSETFWTSNVVSVSKTLVTKKGWDPESECAYVYFSKPKQEKGAAMRPVMLRCLDVEEFGKWLIKQIREIDSVGDSERIIPSLLKYPKSLDTTHKDEFFWDGNVTKNLGKFRARTYYDTGTKEHQIVVNNEFFSKKYREDGWFGPVISMSKGSARRLVLNLVDYAKAN